MALGSSLRPPLPPGEGSGNWVGPVGAAVAESLTHAFGWAAWLIVLEAALATARLFRRRPSPLGWALPPVLVSSLFLGSAFLHLVLEPRPWGPVPLPGGVLGELLGEVGRALLGSAGAVVVAATLVLVALLLRTQLSLRGLAGRVVAMGAFIADRFRRSARALAEAWREAEALDRREREAGAPRVVGVDTLGDPTEAAGATVAGDGGSVPGGRRSRRRPGVDTADAAAGDDPESGPRPTASGRDASLEDEGSRDAPGSHARSPRSADGSAVDDDLGASGDAGSGPGEPPSEAARLGRAIGGGLRRGQASSPAAPAGGARPPRIVPPEDTGPPPGPSSAGGVPAPRVADGYQPPPTSLLDAAPPSGIAVDAGELRANADRLVDKLEAYGVKGRVDEIHPGPVVTMYEFEPRSGTKIAKIAGLADDLAMALAAQKVRIVAPIPGKARVGFELPNDQRQTVYLRQVLEDERWRRLKGALPVAFGKDIAGQPVYGDLAKMPHLLVAGATGSGKSVGINVMLCSLLQQKTPEEVRLLMIDPKVVELAVFDGIPHMLLPVVTDMRKAALALRWAVDEMERRYQLFADAGARNIASFNERVERVAAGGLAQDKFWRRGKGPRGEDQGSDSEPAGPPEKLPYVVVVVDEFADLMMVAAKDVEACIARLAQKARAAGIHVVLATQRPSVDVITGMIKANFPSRVAFKVSQREDSKTILGRSGAEHLLGMGDMLMLPPGTGDLKRVHSAYVSEDEVRVFCDHLRAQGEPVYDEEILRPRDDDGDGPGPAGGSGDDPLYDRAVAAVAQAGYCSISHLQRQLGVGYNKAAKLVEQMEREGVVGPASGKAGGRREVFVQPV